MDRWPSLPALSRRVLIGMLGALLLVLGAGAPGARASVAAGERALGPASGPPASVSSALVTSGGVLNTDSGVTTDQTACPIGTVLTTTGTCVPVGTTGACPVGYVLVNGGCVPVAGGGSCPAGFVPTSAGCLPASTASGCPAGSILVSGSCLPLSGSGVCPVGTVLTATGCLATGTGLPFATLTTVQGQVGQTLTFSIPTTVVVPADTIFTWSFGDGGTASGPTVQHAYTAAGTYTVTLTAISPSTGMSGSATGTAVITGTTTSAGAASLSIAGPSSATIGQTLTFTVGSATIVPSDAVVTWSFGDGTSASGQSVAHAFAAAGTYTVTAQLTSAAAPASNASGALTVMVSSPATTTTSNPSGPSVSFAAGWNLVGGPSGTVFSSAVGTLFTFQAGDTSYETLPVTSGITGGRGYWAYFSAPATVSLTGSGPALPVTVSVPAGQFIMVGNPSATQTVTVSGADAVYTFEPSTNSYQGSGGSATLRPGQAAWVYSNAGGTVTIR